MFVCAVCTKTFTRSDNLSDEIFKSLPLFVCAVCDKISTRLDNLRGHELQSCRVESFSSIQPTKKIKKYIPSISNITCPCCNVSLPMNRTASHVRTIQHRTKSSIPTHEGVRFISPLKYRISSYGVNSSIQHNDFRSCFNDIKGKVKGPLE